MKKLFYTSLLLMFAISMPAIAQAASILDLQITGIFGCYGSAFGTSCSSDEQKLFTTIACKVMKMVDSAIIPLYCNITQSAEYTLALNALLTLYVIFYGFSFVAGLTKASLGELIIAIIKASLIYAILTNAGFFFTFIYQAVVDTPQQLIQTVLLTHGSGAQNIFEYVDEGMYRIFSEATRPELTAGERQTVVAQQLSIFAIAVGVKALMPGGNFIYGLFMFVVMGWLFSYLSIVVRYLLAYIGIVFLLMLAPIFLPSILFKRTMFLWQEWFKMISSFMIEIIIVVAFVLMIEQFYTEFYDMLKKSFNDLTMTQGDTKYIKAYNAGAANEYIKEETVQGVQDPIGSFNQAGFSGDADKITGEIMIQLVTMAVIVFLSSVFLRYIPTFAGMLAGQYNYSRMFGGQSFSNKEGVDRANLFGQTGGYKRQATGVTADADKPGGVWSDFIGQINPLN